MRIAMLFLGAATLSSCGSDKRLDDIEKKLAHLDTAAAKIRGWQIVAGSSEVWYILSDVARDRKTVGEFSSARTVTVGDRVFLGDDMWDVKYVKVFGSRPDTANTSNIRNVELLVSYAGKAGDSKPTR